MAGQGRNQEHAAIVDAACQGLKRVATASFWGAILVLQSQGECEDQQLG